MNKALKAGETIDFTLDRTYHTDGAGKPFDKAGDVVTVVVVAVLSGYYRFRDTSTLREYGVKKEIVQGQLRARGGQRRITT